MAQAVAVLMDDGQWLRKRTNRAKCHCLSENWNVLGITKVLWIEPRSKNFAVQQTRTIGNTQGLVQQITTHTVESRAWHICWQVNALVARFIYRPMPTNDHPGMLVLAKMAPYQRQGIARHFVIGIEKYEPVAASHLDP